MELLSTWLGISPFLFYALKGGMIAALCCGVIGPLIVVSKEGHLAGGISHTLLGGMGVAVWLGVSPYWGAVVTAILVSQLMTHVSHKFPDNQDTLISATWAFGIAIGVIFLSMTPGSTVELHHFLFGNILLISKTEILQMLLMTGVLLLGVFLCFRQLESLAFDQEFAEANGMKVYRFLSIRNLLISLAIVNLIQVVGLVLVMALMTLPSVVALSTSRSLLEMMLKSVLYGAFFVIVGLLASWFLDLPGGPAIIVSATLFYLLDFLRKRIFVSL